MKRVFSIVISFIFGIVLLFFITCISFKVYNINDFNSMITLMSNNLNINKINMDFIYKQAFMNINFIIFIALFILVTFINIKNKFYSSFKYIGSSALISSSFILIGGIFFDKITSMLDKNVAIILNSNRIGFLNSINRKGILFLMLGFLLIILYSVIDTLYEKYKNKKIVNDTIELIEETK